MMPTEGQHVKCILRTGAMAEGIVEEWFNNVVQLRSLDGESILIIPHPNEDIMLIKIIAKMPKIDLPLINEVTDTTDVETSEGVRVVEHEISVLERKFQEAKNLSTADPNKAKTLADLRIMMAEQEKKIISHKVRNHYPSETKKVQYGYPELLKKQSPK
jgi:hypothetical protein